MGSVNGGYIADDARSHVSGYSLNKSGQLMRSRSLAEGQPQRAMSAMSGRYLASGLPLNAMMGTSSMGLTGLGMSAMPGMSAMSGMSAMALSPMGLSRAGSATPLLKCRHKSRRQNEPRTSHASRPAPPPGTDLTDDADKSDQHVDTTPPTSSA